MNESPTLSGAITTFALCFAVAYLTQIVFGRFFVALALFDTVSTTDALERCKNSRTGVSRESKS